MIKGMIWVWYNNGKPIFGNMQKGAFKYCINMLWGQSQIADDAQGWFQKK